MNQLVAPTSFMISINRSWEAMVNLTVLEITKTAAAKTTRLTIRLARRKTKFQRSRTSIHVWA